MSITVILHMSDEAPVVGEVEELPQPGDQFVSINNPRQLDGKDLHYLARGVVNVLWPMHRLNFIEITPTDEEDQIIGFVRE